MCIDIGAIVYTVMNTQDSYKPPIEVRNNARRALELRRTLPPSKRGMTPVGIARARDLATGRSLSLDTIQRMKSFFDRHAVDKQSENWAVGSKGWQAWMGWGGDAGRRWVERILAEALKDETVKKEQAPAPVDPALEQKPNAPVTAVVTPPISQQSSEPEGGMAIGQLRAISAKAMQLSEILTPDSELEPWVSSLISVAAYQINAIYDYMTYPAKKETASMNKTLKKGAVVGDTIQKMALTKTQQTFGGKPREKLEDDDFVIYEERKFPVMTAADVSDAVSSWGRYAGGSGKGKISFDTFKERLIELAQKKGFEDALPEEWKREMNEEGVEKAAFAKYATFMKANPDQRLVVGYASSERIDGQNDIVDSEALHQALDDYMQWANLREMHQPKAVGKVLSATPIKGQIRLSDGTVLSNPLRIIAKIVDEDAWQKVKAGILKGFSIGGKVLNAITQKVNGKEVRRITGLVLNEISLVDRPANPDARIVMMKRFEPLDITTADLAKMVQEGKVDDILRKAKQADPQDILPLIQQLRNQAEIDGDLDTAERYNEVITLMLEAMGVIPTGTVREIDEMEEPVDDLDNMPDDMADMEVLYQQNGQNDSEAAKRRNTIMFADQPTDILKAGRAISKANMETLADIARAAEIIQMLVAKLGLEAGQGGHMHGQKTVEVTVVPTASAESAMSPAEAETTAEEMAEEADEAEEAKEESDEPVGNAPAPEQADSAIPALTATDEAKVMSALANAPRKVMPGNNTGAPIHRAINPNAPAQNVVSGYPIQRSASIEDLRKASDDADAVDIAQLEEEMSSMEETIANTTPAPEETTEKADTAPAVDVSMVLQEVIAKSLTTALAGTVAQLDTVAKAVERIETKATEQNTAVWDALKPITESVETTKSMVEPLVGKVDALEGLSEQVKQLGARLENIENQPQGGGAMLRSTTVNKSLGIDGGAVEEQDEVQVLQKMIGETANPLVKTQLRERLALLETKRALFRR